MKPFFSFFLLIIQIFAYAGAFPDSPSVDLIHGTSSAPSSLNIGGKEVLLKFDYDSAGKIKEVLYSCDEGEIFTSGCLIEYQPGVTTVTDPHGIIRRYYYDENGQVILTETAGAELYERCDYEEGKLLSKSIWNKDGLLCSCNEEIEIPIEEESFQERFLNFFDTMADASWLSLRDIFEYLTGDAFLLLSGYHTTEAAAGHYGKGEVSPQVRVSYINGILTMENGLLDTVKDLSETHGNVNVHYIYRPTRGWIHDILHSFAVQQGVISEQAEMLASLWKTLIDEMGGVEGGGKIIHYAHSIGAVETMRALSLLTEAEQRLIFVYAFGSPTVAQDNPSYQMHHYVSIRDGVCLLDLISFIQAASGDIPNVVFAGSFLGFPFIDHLFRDQTYRDIWKSMGRTFVDWYGSL